MSSVPSTAVKPILNGYASREIRISPALRHLPKSLFAGQTTKAQSLETGEFMARESEPLVFRWIFKAILSLSFTGAANVYPFSLQTIFKWMAARTRYQQMRS